MSDFLNKKLKRLAVILKDRGLIRESSKVLSMLNEDLPHKRAGATEDERADKLRAELKGITGEKESVTPALSSHPDPNVASRKNEKGGYKPKGDGKKQDEKGGYKPKGDGKKQDEKGLSPKEEGSPPREEDLSLKVKSKNKSAVERMQRALVRAGFDLPRFGVDGLFGKETKSAVIAFKEKAKLDGEYSGTIDEIVNNDTLKLIESYPDKSSSLHGTGPRITKGDFTLYLGDSQMVMALGKALMSAGGPGVRVARSSTQAKHWAKPDPDLIAELMKGPSKIIISLNGNGISGTAKLLELLVSYIGHLNIPVIWTGAPPPLRRRKSGFTYLNSDKGFAGAYDKRNDNNKKVGDLVRAHGWTFINPYKHIKYDKPQVIGGRIFESGYTCDKCDGIHLPSHAAKEYVSKISGLL